MKKAYLIFLVLLSYLTVYAEVPREISYNGRLREYGQAVTGTKTMRFTIYDALNGGSDCWTSGDVSVSVNDGAFSYVLAPNIDWRGKDYYIETVVTGKILSPREKITAQAYALHSQTAEYIKTNNDIDFVIGGSTVAKITSSGGFESVYGSFHDRGDPTGLDFASDSFVKDGNWHDLNLSGVVPEGAKAVLLHVVILDSSPNMYVIFRKRGNVNSYNVSTIRTQVANIEINSDIIVSCDNDRRIQYLTSNGTIATIDVKIGGWWK